MYFAYIINYRIYLYSVSQKFNFFDFLFLMKLYEYLKHNGLYTYGKFS